MHLSSDCLTIHGAATQVILTSNGSTNYKAPLLYTSSYVVTKALLSVFYYI